MVFAPSLGSSRDYYVSMVAAFGICMTSWWILKQRERALLSSPPLVSLSRRQVAKYWLDGMYWKAILVAVKEAKEKWGSSVFRIRGPGFFDAPSIYCIDASYVEILLGPSGLEKHEESYEALKDAFGQGYNCLITRKMEESYNAIRKPIMNFFSLSNIGKRLECCRSKLEEFLQIWDNAAEQQQTIELGRYFCDLVMDILGIVAWLFCLHRGEP